MPLLFQDEHIAAIRDGVKTETRRQWADNYGRPTEGSIQMATTEMFATDDDCDCYIRILDVRREPLGEMDHETARAEGGYDLDDFREAWEEINGEPFDPEEVVDVVEFEYVGRQRPEEPDLVTDGGREQKTARQCSDCGMEHYPPACPRCLAESMMRQVQKYERIAREHREKALNPNFRMLAFETRKEIRELGLSRYV